MVGPMTLTPIALEGNIGIEKSTLLNKLKSLGQATTTTLREPLQQWINHGKMNLLDRMYNNPKKWSFVFQSLAMTTVLQNHIRRGTTKIMERSLGSTYNVFLKAHHDNNTMDHHATAALQTWYHTATELYDTVPNVIIYLRARPELAMSRIKLRGRREEKQLTMRYLRQLHTLYDDWLLKNTQTRIIVLNANQSTEDMFQDLDLQLTDFRAMV